jgi:hypothetical protein
VAFQSLRHPLLASSRYRLGIPWSVRFPRILFRLPDYVMSAQQGCAERYGSHRASGASWLPDLAAGGDAPRDRVTVSVRSGNTTRRLRLNAVRVH